MIEDPKRRGGHEPSRDERGERTAGAADVTADADLDEADRALIDDLRDVGALLDPVPDETVLAARSMLAYLHLDAALAELTFDSLTDAAPVAVRSQAVAARQLSFDAGEFQVELEVVHEAGQCRLVGQCVPADEVEITVHQRGGFASPAESSVARISTDDLGRFVVDVAPGQVSLHCRWRSSDVTVATSWVAV